MYIDIYLYKKDVQRCLTSANVFKKISVIYSVIILKTDFRRFSDDTKSIPINISDICGLKGFFYYAGDVHRD